MGVMEKYKKSIKIDRTIKKMWTFIVKNVLDFSAFILYIIKITHIILGFFL